MQRKSKIAIVTTLHSPILPAYPGGIEVFTYELSSELARSDRKNEVVLFAVGGSQTKAKLYEVCPKPLFKLNDLDPSDPQNMRKIIYLENHYYIKIMDYIEKNNFDIVHHSHTSFIPIYLGFRAKIPQLLTAHMTGNSNITLNMDINELLPKKTSLPIISISKMQAKLLSDFEFYDNIYHGIDLGNFDFSQNGQDYFAWLGRIAPNKGTKEAIEIAIKANVKFKFAGEVGVGKNVVDYFAMIKKNYLNNPLISFLGPVASKERNNLLGNAKAFLFPVQCEEPFGLVLIEAMACGTPVIAYGRGSIPEIIEDGKTGFVCPANDENSMHKAIEKINNMPKDEYLTMRAACRKRVEENYTIGKMVDQYERVYQKIINGSK